MIDSDTLIATEVCGPAGPKKHHAGRLSYGNILEPGTPVRLVDPVNGPSCRTGVVIEHKPFNGGYLVKHLEPDAVLKASIIGTVMKFDCQTFGWCYDEIEPIQ